MNQADIIFALSEVSDGSMSASVDEYVRFENRRNFLSKNGVTSEQTALVYLTYNGDDYKRFYTVSTDQAGDGLVRPATIVADSLFTKNKGLALLIPIADCIAATMYDPVNQVIGLVHLGRHNLVQLGGSANVRYMQDNFGSNPDDIQVWLSPAAGRGNYPLYDFDNRSLHEVATEQLLSAGISHSHIEVDARDTTTNPQLFSHSQFLKGTQTTDGRQAAVCMMKL